MLGPFMTIVRPVAAIFSACLAGVLAELAPQPRRQAALQVVGGAAAEPCCAAPCATGCAADEAPGPAAALPGSGAGAAEKCCATPRATTRVTGGTNEGSATSDAASCTAPCATGCGCADAPGRTAAAVPWWRRLLAAAGEMMDDLALWMGLGIVAAALIATFVPPVMMARWGSGLPAMLAVLVVAVPMYICATSSTPIAAALILAGVSPGTALVFMLAGPASNFSAVAVLRRELGTATVAAYLTGICVGAVAMGLLTDWLIGRLGINVVAQTRGGAEWLPAWAGAAVAVMLVLFAVRPLRRLAGSVWGEAVAPAAVGR
jgi:uncharacterized protein